MPLQPDVGPAGWAASRADEVGLQCPEVQSIDCRSLGDGERYRNRFQWPIEIPSKVQ